MSESIGDIRKCTNSSALCLKLNLHNDKSTKIGFHQQCKSCTNQKPKEYQNNNIDKRNDYSKKK